jgi:GntR family transcriptional repressor for pyruvate dehydrogenase complex
MSNISEQTDPADYVIEKIRHMIEEEVLSPGDRFPSEKKLEESFELPRGVISKALKRLETYGLVRTVPQSGTYLADFEKEVLDGLITSITHEQNHDYESLAEVRQELEVYAVELVVQNASDEDLQELEAIQKKLERGIQSGNFSLEEDMVFHLKIAQSTKNIILKSVLTRLSVEMIDKLNVFSQKIGPDKLLTRLRQAIEEHEKIITALKSRDREKAKEAMIRHFDSARQFRKASL